MLFWHKHNIDKALTDLANFTPFPDEWTVEDKVLFEQAFSFHGKSFHRIRQMVRFECVSNFEARGKKWNGVLPELTSSWCCYAKEHPPPQCAAIQGPLHLLGYPCEVIIIWPRGLHAVF